MSNNLPWYKRCLKEIDSALNQGRKSRKLGPWEKWRLDAIRPKIENDLGLTRKDEDDFRSIHCRLTDPVRIYR